VTARALRGGGFGRGLGVVAADVNGDGWTDIYVANDGGENLLWINLHDGTFRDEALTAGVAVTAEGHAEASMGVDAGDFDNDGDEDVRVANDTGPAQLLINTLNTRGGAARHWIGLRLVGTAGHRDMPGARVEIVRAGQPSLWRRVRADGSYASANDPRVL